ALIALRESQHRIQAMAFIHQKLYQSLNLSSVEMSAYIHELVDYLQHSFDTRLQVTFRLEIQKLSFDLSHALPLALILNEAITNSIKYGFPGGKPGIISITLQQLHPGHFSLVIADNGIGIAPEFNYKDSDTMGMKLIKGLSEDIHGNMEIQNRDGTTIIISFAYDTSALNDMPVHNTAITKEKII
ncbi:MAG: sensor histidine kinase, partial [Chitinophagaceae bacterium]